MTALRDHLTPALNHRTFALTHLIAQDVYYCLEIPPTYSCPFRNEFYVGLIWPCINCPHTMQLGLRGRAGGIHQRARLQTEPNQEWQRKRNQ